MKTLYLRKVIFCHLGKQVVGGYTYTEEHVAQLALPGSSW